MNAGLHTMDAETYHADPAEEPSLSFGIANTIITLSPQHAWFEHPRLNPHHQREESNTFDLGSCAHAVLLEGESKIYPIDAPDWRKKDAQAARDDARTRGLIPVLAHKLTQIRAMADAAREALLECELGPIDLGTGKAEQVLVWREGDAWCRARPDWMRNDRKLIIDYKSTAGSANPQAWIRNQMGPMGYDMQCVHYGRGNAATGGDPNARWLFLVQENRAPFVCSFVALGDAMYEIAQRKWNLALAIWTDCMKSGKWPGYPRQIAYAEPTSWQMVEDDERRMAVDEQIGYAEQA